MIKLLRVDHRLLHGQVAMAWTQSLDSDCILIANDAVVNDNIRKTTMKLAKPNGVKLVMKNIEDSIAALNAGVTDKYKLFIVVESIEDAYRLAKGYAGIRSINLGGCKPKEDIVKTLYKTIPVTARDEEMLKELLNDGTFSRRETGPPLIRPWPPMRPTGQRSISRSVRPSKRCLIL